jgi:hypothetical protein
MEFTGIGDFTTHTVATNHTIGILHVPDTTALGDFLIRTVSLLITDPLIDPHSDMEHAPRFLVALSPCLPIA